MKIRIFFYTLLLIILFGNLSFLIMSCSKDESTKTEINSSTNIDDSRNEPKYRELLYKKAKNSFHKGLYQESLRQFQELSEKDKSALTGVGLSYYMLNDYINAAIYLEDALANNNTDFTAQKFLAFSYYHMNEIHKSLSHAEKALALKEDNELTNLHSELIQKSKEDAGSKALKVARKLFDRGDYQRALSLYKDLSEKDKSALAGAGLSYFMLKDYVNAIIYLEESLTYRSNDFEARKHLALAYEKVNEPQKSLFHTKAALSLRKNKELESLYRRLAPNDSAADNRRHHARTSGQIDNQRTWQEAGKRFRQGDYEGAAHLYKKASRSNKKAYTQVGYSYFNLKNYSSAIDYLKKAVDYNTHDFLANKLLALSYNETQDSSKSLTYAEKGLSIKKDAQLQFLYNKLRKDQNTWDNYDKSETPHFTLLYDGDVHGDARRKIIDILEDAYGAIGRQLNYFPSQKIIVILYTRKKFTDVTKAPGWAGALYDGKIRMPIKGIQGRDNILERILFHEYTHALVHSITPNCPLWINEGLAEYFSKKSPRKIGQVIPLSYLEKSFMGLRGRRVSDAYLESFSAVSDLIDQYGLYRMKKLLFAFARTGNYNEAFSSALSISYDDFISDWGRG